MREVTITKRYYKFDELSEDAKALAIEEWRNGSYDDTFYTEDVTDEAVEIAGKIGIDIGSVRGTSKEPAIYWHYSCSQGDGACFEGRYRFVENAATTLEDGEWCAEPRRIAETLAEIQARYDNTLWADMAHRGHYYHSGSMSVECDCDCADDDDEKIYVSADDCNAVERLMRDFAEWIFDRIQADYRFSDECIRENILCNEYEFLENGKMA